MLEILKQWKCLFVLYYENTKDIYIWSCKPIQNESCMWDLYNKQEEEE